MRKRRAATVGHNITVRKGRNIHISTPGRITRLIDRLLKLADLPYGGYAYMIEKLSTASVTGEREQGISIEQTLHTGQYQLTFQLSRRQDETFTGTLEVPTRIAYKETLAKLRTAVTQLIKERWEDHSEERVPVAASRPFVVPPASEELEQSPVSDDQSMLGQARGIIAALQRHGEQLQDSIRRLDAEMEAEIEKVRARYQKIKAPVLVDIGQARENAAQLSSHLEYLEALEQRGK
jgi:C terminal SARAH domain of Mst1